MARSKTVMDPPPPLYSKFKATPGPFSKKRCHQCCLSEKQWRQLREWLTENYHHPDLPDSDRGKMKVDKLLAFAQDRLWSELGVMLLRHHVMEVDSLSFKAQLDEAAIAEAVKNLGWSIDQKGEVVS